MFTKVMFSNQWTKHYLDYFVINDTNHFEIWILENYRGYFSSRKKIDDKIDEETI